MSSLEQQQIVNSPAVYIACAVASIIVIGAGCYWLAMFRMSNARNMPSTNESLGPGWLRGAFQIVMGIFMLLVALWKLTKVN
jgi:hypothetical protein